MILRGLFFGIRLGFIIASLSVLWILGLIIFTQRIPMTPEDFTTKTEGIVVFTGGNARLKEGFLLLEQGLAPRLLISGVNPDATLLDLTKAANINVTFSKNQVTLGFQADDTIENAKEAANWVNKQNINSLRLVTSNYHMPRSLLEIHQELPHLHIIPHPVVAGTFKHKKWWTDQKTILNVIREYNKYLFALGRYTITTLERML